MDSYLTVKEVADKLHVHPRTVMRRLKEHPEIRPLKPGRSLLFDRVAIGQLEEAIRCAHPVDLPIISPVHDVTTRRMWSGSAPATEHRTRSARIARTKAAQRATRALLSNSSTGSTLF
jgi:excisionase family DNA binding protein